MGVSVQVVEHAVSEAPYEIDDEEHNVSEAPFKMDVEHDAPIRRRRVNNRMRLKVEMCGTLNKYENYYSLQRKIFALLKDELVENQDKIYVDACKVYYGNDGDFVLSRQKFKGWVDFGKIGKSLHLNLKPIKGRFTELVIELNLLY